MPSTTVTGPRLLTGQDEAMSRALVLAGGGLAGIAWEVGLLVGLTDAGIDLRSFDLVVGTSAGAVVAANWCSAASTAELLAGQTDPARQAPEPTSPVSTQDALAVWEQLGRRYPDHADFVRALCARALGRHPADGPARLAAVAQRLVTRDWPDAPLSITGVDAGSAERVVFRATDGVPLPLAVAASCAIPLVWPTVEIAGRRYVDGGTGSAANADLAGGHDRVLVLHPMVGAPDQTLPAELALLSDPLVLRPDGAVQAATGDDPLDPAVREPVARAALAQAAGCVEQVRAFWRG